MSAVVEELSIFLLKNCLLGLLCIIAREGCMLGSEISCSAEGNFTDASWHLFEPRLCISEPLLLGASFASRSGDVTVPIQCCNAWSVLMLASNAYCSALDSHWSGMG